MSEYDFKYVKPGQKRIPGEMENTIWKLSYNSDGARKEIAALKARLAACKTLVNIAHKNEFMLLTKEDSYQICYTLFYRGFDPSCENRTHEYLYMNGVCLMIWYDKEKGTRGAREIATEFTFTQVAGCPQVVATLIKRGDLKSMSRQEAEAWLDKMKQSYRRRNGVEPYNRKVAGIYLPKANKGKDNG